jgi:putative methyltransferase
MYVDRPDDENEIADIVVATASLTLDDWVACQLFAQAIQVLHNGCYTRYVAMHLRRRYGIRYVEFYRRMVATALEDSSTVLGSVLRPLERLYRRAGEDGSAPYTHLVASDRQMLARVSGFGTRKGWTPDQWGWLCISAEFSRFTRELESFVEHLGPAYHDEIGDVLRYQADIVLALDYDAAVGKRCRYDYDLPTYFAGGELVRRPTQVWFRDRSMGANFQYPLEKVQPRMFAKAAVGESYPMVRVCHFQHQLNAARITYDDIETFTEASHVACQ